MKLTKRDRALIDNLAKDLPFIEIYNSEISEISGEDVILAGTEEIDGQKVEKDKSYFMKVPVSRQVRHDKRMRKHFQNFGVNGILDYVQKFVKTERRAEARRKIKQAWKASA